MGCFGDAKWKREKIQDHKFDYVDVDEFVDESCPTQFKYSMVFVITLKTILTYMAELGVVILLILTFTKTLSLDDQSQKSTTGQAKKPEGLSNIPIEVRIGFITGSVVFSYVLLAIEWRKSLLIVKSRDISYAFTSTVAYRYYVIRSYAHFCFFEQIRSSRKIKDILSFWVYFRLKGWKRLLLAEGPRQFFNVVNLYDIILIALANEGKKPTGFLDYFRAIPIIIAKEKRDVLALYALSTLTISIWLISFLTLVIATFVYIYLLFSIRGNLKEYCVHKFDKRIDELLKRKSRKRVREARQAELEELERHQALDEQGQVRALPPMGLSRGPRLPNVYMEPEEEFYQYGSDFDVASETGSGNAYLRNPHFSVYSNGMPHQVYPPATMGAVSYPYAASSSDRPVPGTGMMYFEPNFDETYVGAVVSSGDTSEKRFAAPPNHKPYQDATSNSMNLYYNTAQGPQGYAPYNIPQNHSGPLRPIAESGELLYEPPSSSGRRPSPPTDNLRYYETDL